jgi:hypothetical protein
VVADGIRAFIFSYRGFLCRVAGPHAELGTRYEHIGHGYARLRREDPRIAARIDEALGDARMPEVSNQMWLVKEYLPEVGELDVQIFPGTDRLAAWLGGVVRVQTLPVHRDSPDWMFGSFWAHPERVLDRDARNATSGFASWWARPAEHEPRRRARVCSGA